MRGFVLVALLLVYSFAAAAPSQTSPRIAALYKDVGKRGAEDAFWLQVAKDGGPIVEPASDGNVLVTFVWRGEAKTKRVAMWGPLGAPAELVRLPGSNVFYVTGILPPTARFTYSFMIDDEIDHPSMTRIDSFNTHIFDPGSSVLALPRAPAQPSLDLHRETPAGALTRHLIDKRVIYVYTPAGYDTKGPAYPLVVAFDANTAITSMPMPQILDELIASRDIPPVVAVLVGNIDRTADLTSDKFTDMIALDLVPWMRATYHATSDPRRTVITGVSLGGLASAMTALHHPEVFGNVLSQSGAFWWAPEGKEPEDLSHWLASAPHLAVRFWMEVGLFEGGPPGATMLGANRHLRDVLIARGNEVTYSEFAGNHTYLQWRGTIATGLKTLFATPPKTAAPPAKAGKRPPFPISAGTASPIARLARIACIDGGDAAIAAAKNTTEEDVDSAAFAAFYLEHAREAVPLLRWNTERFPKSLSAWDSYAWLQYTTGDRKGAQVSFKKELELDPDNKIAKRMLTIL